MCSLHDDAFMLDGANRLQMQNAFHMQRELDQMAVNAEWRRTTLPRAMKEMLIDSPEPKPFLAVLFDDLKRMLRL